MNVQTSELNKWEVCENMLPEGLTYSQFVTTGNRVYLLGGWNGDTWVSSVYSAPIDSEGVIGTWSKAASLPGPLSSSQAIVTKTRVYLLGGYNDGGFIATVYSAPIDSEGVIGEWGEVVSLPGPLADSQAIVTKTRVYLLGGYSNSGFIATVYSAPIDSEGVIGEWSTAASLPGPLADSQAIVTKTRVYLLGGYNGSNPTSTVYSAPIDSEGVVGEWTTVASLPGPLDRSQVMVTKTRVYLLGGGNDSGLTPIMYSAPIDSEGVVGTWSTTASLPGPLSSSQAIVTKNRVYLLGGINDRGDTVAGYTVPIDSEGVIGTWNTTADSPLCH